MAIALCTACWAQPKLKMPEPESYRPGETIDKNIDVLDRDMHRHRLGELIREDTQVVVLLIIGGATLETEDGAPRRGDIWCPDTFDDFGVQRALVHQFKDKPVQFIPIAVPPVYNAEYFGYKDVFLTRPDGDPELAEQTRRFIDATEKERSIGVIPFDDVFYDPKFRTAQNKDERELGSEFGTIYEWQGKLKWHMDPRTYGTPTIWLLDGQGHVLCDPFFGNDYDGDPPQVAYGYADVRKEIERNLKGM